MKTMERFAQQLHRGVYLLLLQIEGGPKPNRPRTATDGQQPGLEKLRIEAIARRSIWQIESNEEAPSSHSGHERLLRGQHVELLKEVISHVPCMIDEVFALDNFKEGR